MKVIVSDPISEDGLKNHISPEPLSSDAFPVPSIILWSLVPWAWSQ